MGDLDAGLLGEGGEELRLDLLGAAGVAGPEVDLLCGVDVREVEIEILGASASVAADVGAAAGGEAQGSRPRSSEAEQGAPAEAARAMG